MRNVRVHDARHAPLSEAAQQFERKRLEAEDRLRVTERDMSKMKDPVMAATLEKLASKKSLVRSTSSSGALRPTTAGGASSTSSSKLP